MGLLIMISNFQEGKNSQIWVKVFGFYTGVARNQVMGFLDDTVTHQHVLENYRDSD